MAFIMKKIILTIILLPVSYGLANSVSTASVIYPELYEASKQAPEKADSKTPPHQTPENAFVQKTENPGAPYSISNTSEAPLSEIEEENYIAYNMPYPTPSAPDLDTVESNIENSKTNLQNIAATKLWEIIANINYILNNIQLEIYGLQMLLQSLIPSPQEEPQTSEQSAATALSSPENQEKLEKHKKANAFLESIKNKFKSKKDSDPKKEKVDKKQKKPKKPSKKSVAS
jgi:hypothetical protein